MLWRHRDLELPASTDWMAETAWPATSTKDAKARGAKMIHPAGFKVPGECYLKLSDVAMLVYNTLVHAR
jgi:hypothetical protein